MASGMSFMGLPIEYYYGNGLDYNGWQQQFGFSGGPNTYDLNRDGLVDIRDWAQLQQYYQAYPGGYQAPPPPPPPQPYTPPPMPYTPPSPPPYTPPPYTPPPQTPMPTPQSPGVDGPAPHENNVNYGNPAPPPPAPTTTPTGGNLNNPMSQHDYWNYMPEAGYAQRLSEQNLSGADPYGRYAQSQYSRYYNQYQGDAAKDPNQGFYDWYGQKGLNPRSEFQNLAPSQRGDNTSSFLTPRARWSMG